MAQTRQPRAFDDGNCARVALSPAPKNRPATREVRQILVGDVMTESVVTLTPETSIKDPLGLLDQHGLSMLPVDSATRTLVGVESEADLIRDAVLPGVLHHCAPAPRKSGCPLRTPSAGS
jgi:CBS-domain-containing membrane protein